jgi:predicted nucleic acid-binding protein
MYSVLLDTSAYIETRRLNPSFLGVLTQASGAAMEPVALGELKAGFQRSRHGQRDEQQLSDFLAEETVRILSVTRETSDRYATLKNYLERIGRPISPNDLWIAAVAWQHGLHLLTAERHFLELPQILTIYHPPL